MHFFTTERLSAKKEKTPEGFLLCRNVVIARTGVQLYGPEETPIAAGPDGVVYIDRPEAEVFRPETIASFNGKPVVDEHPRNEDETWEVNPDNWKELAVGVSLDVRRGAGDEKDFLIADLLITDAETIKEVLEGKREISCGYSAEYVETSPGHGYQKNILGNHVALVEQARCGAICSIGDGKMKKSLWDRIKDAVAAKDESALGKIAAEIPAPALAALTRDDASGEVAPGVHVHLEHGGGSDDDKKWRDDFEKRFGEHDKLITDLRKAHDDFSHRYDDDAKKIHDALEEIKNVVHAKPADDDDKEIEGSLKEEAPAGATGDVAKAKDSVFLRDSFQETVALAEILAPGIQVPVFDSAKRPGQTYKDICGLRKRALAFANNAPDTNGMILSVRGGRAVTADSLEKMPCPEARTLFLSVAALKKVANNTTDRSGNSGGGTRTETPKPLTVADVNKRNREFWGPKK
jgi:hypothetical protein